jgi:hypothetical protein
MLLRSKTVVNFGRKISRKYPTEFKGLRFRKKIDNSGGMILYHTWDSSEIKPDFQGETRWCTTATKLYRDKWWLDG